MVKGGPIGILSKFSKQKDINILPSVWNFMKFAMQFLIASSIIVFTMAFIASSEVDEPCGQALSLLKEDPIADYNHAKLLLSKCHCFEEDPSEISKAIECYQKVNKCCDLILAQDDCDSKAIRLQDEAVKGEEEMDAMIRPPPGGEKCTCTVDCNHESIIAKYDRAISKNRSDIVAWNDRGALLGELCCKEDAMKSFNRAIEINPTIAEPWYNKGILLFYDKHQDALNCINKSIELNPQIAEAWFNKYALLMPGHIDMSKSSSRNAFDEAMNSYNKALSLNPALGEYLPPYLEFVRMA
jgi:tetratricopeptide (TPR) repeat protein